MLRPRLHQNAFESSLIRVSNEQLAVPEYYLAVNVQALNTPTPVCNNLRLSRPWTSLHRSEVILNLRTTNWGRYPLTVQLTSLQCCRMQNLLLKDTELLSQFHAA